MSAKLGFDFNLARICSAATCGSAGFEARLCRVPGWHQSMSNGRPMVSFTSHPSEAGSIPSHVVLPAQEPGGFGKKVQMAVQWSEDRDEQGGVAGVESRASAKTARLALGSLYGNIRSMLTLKGAVICWPDDEPAFQPRSLTPSPSSATGGEIHAGIRAKFDFAHSGRTFAAKTGRAFRRRCFATKVGRTTSASTDLARKHGLDHLLPRLRRDDRRVDSDLDRERRQHDVPDRGGTWEASIRPWRKKWAGPSRRRWNEQECVCARPRRG